MTFAALARAQILPCDQLQNELASRIDASGARGYALEVVPAETPVPPGAIVVGTCEAGTGKILYHGGRAARPSLGGAAGPSTAPRASRSRRQQSDLVVQPAPAPMPSLAPRDNPRAAEAVPATPAPGPEPERPASATRADVPRIADLAASQPVPSKVDESLATVAPLAPQAPQALRAPQSTQAPQATDFMAGLWVWILALALVPVAGGIWFWRARRSGYDEAGLPRGPRL